MELWQRQDLGVTNQMVSRHFSVEGHVIFTHRLRNPAHHFCGSGYGTEKPSGDRVQQQLHSVGTRKDDVKRACALAPLS